ncbi:MAG: hypothetical protein LBJ48_07220 [Coriobacteriales bacterium]|nr:hypothetical protein [Coriobacteriales bacterium]
MKWIDNPATLVQKHEKQSGRKSPMRKLLVTLVTLMTVCLILSLAACEGSDRTVSLANGVSITVPSDWRQQKGEREGWYDFETDKGKISVMYNQNSPEDPYDYIARFLNDLEESGYYTKIEILSQRESMIGGVTCVITEYSYTHSSLGEDIRKTAHFVRNDSSVQISYGNPTAEYDPSYFDALVLTLDWR